MELLETVKKIYDEHLPASYIQRSEEEKDALKKLNALNRKLNPDSAEWEKMDDLFQELTDQAEKTGFITGFTYALTFLEKVYGLSDLDSLFKED